MKVPVFWLKDYVDINVSAQELGDALTLSGSKVEEVITSNDEITNVVTGKIMDIKPHPDAEKLVICALNIGKDENIQIVTGADNMKVGDIVPVALHGSTLPNGLKIKKGKLRGVMSNGMMCSAEELGLEDKDHIHGLMILKKDTPIGLDIKEALNINNAVIDFEITSNRPDCLSILGIGRETAATYNTALSEPSLDYKTISDDKTDLNIEIRDSLCKRYMARVIKNVKIQPSPDWMQERLKQAGVRAINNIVDITNFVMLELGQPMHAFDKNEIKSGKIVVDRAKNDEKFVTLDGIERTLNNDVLCIKDDNSNIGLAGIMGGLDSEVKEDTKEIVFESACFDGTNIRKNSKKMNIRTEASSRYEKDLDPELAEKALDRACNLVCQLNAGEIVNYTFDIYPNKAENIVLRVDGLWVNSFLGIELSLEEMKECLQRLQIKTQIEGNDLVINVPSFRGDLRIREDIAEEIARIYGYNKIPATIAKTSGEKGGKSNKQIMDEKVTNAMTNSGFNQTITYTFTSPKIFDKLCLPKDSTLRNVVSIRNPLGEDFSIMRTTTLDSMLQALDNNYSVSNDYVRLFELGKVYLPKEDITKLPNEKNMLSIAMYGECDFLDLKGAVENVLLSLGISNVSYIRETENKMFHPGKTATLKFNNESIGILGEIHPDVRENYGIDCRCFIAEINLDILYSNAKLNRKYSPIPKFPSVSRDIALLVEDSILVQEIENIIYKQGGKILEGVKLFDVYKGKQVPEGKKSIAYSITYRNENKTLTDEEVNKVHDKIVRSLENILGAQLR